MPRLEKPGRKPVGTAVRNRDDTWTPMVTLADKSRTRVRDASGRPLKYATQPEAKREAKHFAKQAQGLRRKPRKVTAVRVDGEMERWLTALYADRTRRLKSRDKMPEAFRKYVEPAIGGKHIRDWTPADCRAIVAYLDGKVHAGEIAWKTATNNWGYITAACSAACTSKVESLRVRDDNPTRDVQGPDKGEQKRLQFLFPSELAALVAYAALPLEYRRRVVASVYLYMRPSEAKVLRRRDIDLTNGIAEVWRAYDRRDGGIKPTKTGQGRKLQIEPAILPLLEVLCRDLAPDDLVFPDMGNPDKLAAPLRKALLLAGVDRPELHEADELSKPMRWYDLRSTGITWRAIRGDAPLDIKHAAGHKRFSTTEGYIHTAGKYNVATFGDVFAPLPAELLTQKRTLKRTRVTQVSGIIVGEGGFETDRAAQTSEITRGQCEEPSSEPAQVIGPSLTAEARAFSACDLMTPDPQSSATGHDPVEVALAAALTRAAEAGEWAVVSQLARELEARRQR